MKRWRFAIHAFHPDQIRTASAAYKSPDAFLEGAGYASRFTNHASRHLVDSRPHSPHDAGVKRLLGYLRRYKARYAAGGVCLLITASLAMAVPPVKNGSQTFGSALHESGAPLSSRRSRLSADRARGYFSDDQRRALEL